jgi:hypothetical protein
MDQANDLKIDALMTIAKAFYDRGSGIQYDELSMDRICRITPRRELFSPPEKATKQHTLFLDCSSFVFSTFYQAFGYIFEADVTNDMIDLSDIRVFYYEIRGNETEDEKISVMKKFKETLQAGDVTVSVYNNGNGHTMLYAGNDTFCHCTSNGRKGSYNYQLRHDNINDNGAIYWVNSSVLFSPEINGIPSRNYLFNEKNLRFCILRPLSKVKSITPETQKRIKGLKNIYAAVTCSHPEGRSAKTGEEVTYEVEVKNLDTSVRNISIIYNDKKDSFQLNPGEGINKSYKEIVNENMVDNKYICTPNILVNDMEIYVPKVVFYNKDYSSDLSSLTPEEIIDGLFEKQAKSEGEVYHLRAGSNLEPILVPGLFGGYGVITPEIVKSPEMRTHRITLSSLQEGNLIIYKDSPYEPAKAVKYYGNERFDFSEGKEASDFVDTLFGCFCFCVIRY